MVYKKAALRNLSERLFKFESDLETFEFGEEKRAFNLGIIIAV